MYKLYFIFINKYRQQGVDLNMKVTIKASKKNGGQYMKKNNNINKYNIRECCQNQSVELSKQQQPTEPQQKLLYKLIKSDYFRTFSKISKTITFFDLYKTISNIGKSLNIKYTPWVGYLCSHCCHHYDDFEKRASLGFEIIKKWRQFFENPQYEIWLINNTLKRLHFYSFLQKNNQQILVQVCKRYQQTLMLQFIPIEYSQFVIQRYLEGSPQEYIRIVVSLVSFIIARLNPINQQHFLQLALRPYMGNVEWPVIIGNRHQYFD